MNVIEALQLALSKPGTKVRPKGEPYWFEMRGPNLVCQSEHSRYFGRLYASEVITPDGQPVEWEEVTT